MRRTAFKTPKTPNREETEAIDADNRQKEFELGRQYIGEFKENIVKPLQTEMKGLKNEVKKLHKNWWQQVQIHPGSALLVLLAAAVVYAVVRIKH